MCGSRKRRRWSLWLGVVLCLGALSGTVGMPVTAEATTCPTLTLSPHGPSFFVLPDGVPSSAYSTTITVSGGSGSYFWQLSGGSLPPGLDYAPKGAGGDTLTISGAPTQVGEWGVQFSVYDSAPSASGCLGAGGNYQINVPGADLSVGQSLSDATVKVGDHETITVSVLNSGPNAASNVRVSDVLSSQLQATSATMSVGGAAAESCAITDTAAEVDCTLGDLTDGSHDNDNMATISIVARALLTGDGTSHAEVLSSTYDPDSTNNSSEVSITVSPPTADLTTSVNVQAVHAFSGENVHYTVTVVNGGPDPAPHTQVLTEPDARESWASVVSAASSLDCSHTVWPVRCNLGTLAPGESESLHVTAHIRKARVNGTLTFDADVRGAVTDPHPENNPSDDSLKVDPSADLSVQLGTGRFRQAAGSYDVHAHLRNDGPDLVHGGVLSVHFSQPGRIRALEVGEIRCDPPRSHVSHVVCNHISLGAGESEMLIIRVEPIDDLTATRVSGRFDSRVHDPDDSNNRDATTSETAGHH